MIHPEFPRRKARTRGFSSGRPRSLTVAPDGSRVLFLRSSSGQDPVQSLWSLDLASGEELLVADPRTLDAGSDDETAEERRRRERAREQSSGIVGYATDRDVRRAVFVLAGRLYVSDVLDLTTRGLDTAGPAFDPRLDPAGSAIAYVTGGALHVTDLDGQDTVLAGDPSPDVTFGLAEFVAAEEMGRLRGFWWSPDGACLAVARVDVSPVDRWHLSDPAHPDREPDVVRYPAAGRPNADVTLALVAADGGREPLPVTWDRERYPYLGRVVWQEGHPLTLEVVSRRQDAAAVLTVEEDGTTQVVRERRDEAWVELASGAPRWLSDGRLLTVEDVVGADDPDGSRAIVLDGSRATPAGLQVGDVVHVGDEHVWFTATGDPRELHVHRLELASGHVVAVTDAAGWHGAAASGDVLAIASATVDEPDVTIEVRRGGDAQRLRSHAADPGLNVDVRFLELTERRLPAALLVPATGEGPWPVLLSPYGGPHAPARSQRSHHIHLEKRWLADQGFAVLVIDGRGTPHRSAAWERAIRFDLATPVLEDQVDGLHAAAELDDRLDLSRVAIRGWSFGGFLAALAALRRPDVFRAAVVGAPVTDWRLYDTFYTERYLGLPDEHPEAYRVSSVVDGDGQLVDAVEPPDGRHPGMLLIHGLADDNVVAAHTLRLSAALLAAGRPHEVLPLTGVTHMTPQETVAENLLRLELDFLRRHLGEQGPAQAGRPSER